MAEPWQGEPERPELPPAIRQAFGVYTPAEVAESEGRYAAAVALGEQIYPTLPIYRRWRRCQKCGSWRSVIAYHLAPTAENGHGLSCVRLAGEHEHFARQCRRCGFVWLERLCQTR